MGKKQVFEVRFATHHEIKLTMTCQRNFRFHSILGLSLILMSSWESLLGTIAFGLSDGGPSGLLYTYLISYLGFIAVVVSMAEMASMAPASGGQYHWVSEFAPLHVQKRLSYLIGWVSILGYQIGVTITAFSSGLAIQGLIVLHNSNTYAPKKWHATAISSCITICVAQLNIFFATQLPLVEGTIMALHIAGWVAIVVVLWVLGPRTPSDNVWKSFLDPGWDNCEYVVIQIYARYLLFSQPSSPVW